MADSHVPTSRPAVALTIAGSEATGGAGAQADLKTFQALDVFGMVALTCIVWFSIKSSDWIRMIALMLSISSGTRFTLRIASARSSKPFSTLSRSKSIV